MKMYISLLTPLLLLLLCVFSLPRCGVSTLTWSTFTLTVHASDTLDGPLISVLEPGQMVNVSVWPLIPGWSQPFVRWVKADSFQLWMGSISVLKAIKQMDRAASEEERAPDLGCHFENIHWLRAPSSCHSGALLCSDGHSRALSLKTSSYKVVSAALTGHPSPIVVELTYCNMMEPKTRMCRCI